MGSGDPQVIEERPLYPEKVTVQCALWSEYMIGIYFFENVDGTTITVNSERYVHMITESFFSVIEVYNLENMWFQQYGTTCNAT